MFGLLFIAVITLFCYMIPGFVLRKAKMVDGTFAKALSVVTLYVAQAALLVHGFIIKFDLKVFKGIVCTFILSFFIHLIFYIIARRLFKKVAIRTRRVLQFGLIFSNAGYMGIPVISDVFGAEYAVYATIYIVWFNIFAFSLGRMIYTDDKKYISVKEVLINPAVIPITIGLIIYISGLGGYIEYTLTQAGVIGDIISILYNVLTALKNMVAPLSMMIIGVKLAEIDFRYFLKDRYILPFSAIRLLIFPFIIWVIVRALNHFGIIEYEIMAIVTVLSSTPAASATAMFAELYDGDAQYAGKLVAFTTLISVVTMPVVSLLFKI